MEVNKAHCLFEQSGTFKNSFIKLGVPAEDYDILNDFGETDNMVDLFAEIDKAYDGEASVFDNVDSKDIILAFYPCTRFEAIIPLAFRGQSYQQTKWTDVKKLKYSMKLHEELHELYIRICKLFAIVIEKNIRTIVENPYTQPHYLTAYFPVKPKLIDSDRSVNGDYYKKPTQFWFIGCEPENNVLFEPIEYVERWTINKQVNADGLSRQVRRSLIHPQYANRFIRQYILNG